MKEKFLRWVLRVLGISAVGTTVTACYGIPLPLGGQAVMYGCPMATYTVKGTVTDEAGNPVTSADVILRSLGKDKQNLKAEGDKFYDLEWYHDTLKVDSEGKYEFIRRETSFGEEDYRVVVQAETYKPDSLEITMRASGGDGDWNFGSDDAIVDFELKKSE